MIKSGGEWISSVELENEIMAHPTVAEAAVIGVPHPKWSERPLACVVLREGETATKDEILAFLDGRVAKWWLPDDVVFVDEIPKTSVGKFSKKIKLGGRCAWLCYGEPGVLALGRLDEKRDRNALIEKRMDQPVEPVEDLLEPGGDDGVGQARFRRVTATGTYDEDTLVSPQPQPGRRGRRAGDAWRLRDEPGRRAAGLRRPRRRGPGCGRRPCERGHGRGPGGGPRQLRRHPPMRTSSPCSPRATRCPLVWPSRRCRPSQAVHPGGRRSWLDRARPAPELSEGPHLACLQWFIFSGSPSSGTRSSSAGW